MNTLTPVRTREDCLSWLTLEEVEREVFGAFVGAQKHAREWDFVTDHGETFPEDAVQPDTLLLTSGESIWDRSAYLAYLAAGIVWRLEALARRKGVDMGTFDVSGYLASNGSECLERSPYFSFLGGEVRTITDADVAAMPAAQRKALKAAVQSGKPVTLPKGSLGGA